MTRLEDRRLRVKDGILPRVCSINTRGCPLDNMTLVIDTRRIDFCPYAEVRRSLVPSVSEEGPADRVKTRTGVRGAAAITPPIGGLERGPTT